jgi:hypothetical protein
VGVGVAKGARTGFLIVPLAKDGEADGEAAMVFGSDITAVTNS